MSHDHSAHGHSHGAHDGHDGHDGHHHHDHNHDDDGHNHTKGVSERRLLAALIVLFAFTLVEAVGGLWANSIALLAEAAHMLADSASLVLAVIAVRMSRRPPSAQHTYGSQRYQTLAAYTNGLILLALTIWVVVEAARRLAAPPGVNGTVMLGVAVLGGIANLAAFLVLTGANSLNERGARAHVLSDLLGSGAAVVAACIILTLHWLPADPLLSIAVSILIFRSGWRITRDSAHVLLEGAPPTFDVDQVEKDLDQVPGVAHIHHLHAWTMTGEAAMVTLHARLSKGSDREECLAGIMERLRTQFGVEHATVQIEEGECFAPAADDCRNRQSLP
jgi:cobalt-zinc-cadmium efflux system protein